ncbi:dephospho-CoA kinase [Pedobacter glucosidilyticus]|uniref:dephospho-CoA kinase n=1 Tax=Pedobacter glucosidilyticus TaxID=1122941 RepID=UPI0026F10ED6|nr:dephospho-CoA kinase [Pedobacter glucosidilyticus]
MMKVGITGGIGSGKTTICKLFELLGIPVFYADTAGKELMLSDLEVKKAVVNLFGEAAYSPNGNLDRKYIADIVFKDDQKLKALNAIIHPAVKDAFLLWSEQQNTPYVLKEAALLFESKSYLDNDYNILVSSPTELRIQRVIARDQTSREKVLERIEKQLPEEEKQKLADFFILNNEELHIIPQVLKLHHQLVLLAQQK